MLFVIANVKNDFGLERMTKRVKHVSANEAAAEIRHHFALR